MRELAACWEATSEHKQGRDEYTGFKQRHNERIQTLKGGR